MPAMMIGSAPSFWTMGIRLVVASARAISSATIAWPERVQRGAAVPLLEAGAQQVLLGQQLLQVPGELGTGVDLRRARSDPLDSASSRTTARSSSCSAVGR